VSVALPEVVHARAVHLRDYLWIRARREAEAVPSLELLSRAAEGDASTTDALLARGVLGFAMVTVTPEALAVDGQTVLSLSGGSVRDADRRGPLLPALMEQVDAVQQGPVDGLLPPAEPGTAARPTWLYPEKEDRRMLLAVDERVPGETLHSVMYSLGQSQVGHFDFVVAVHDQPSVPDGMPVRARAPDSRLDVTVHQGGFRVERVGPSGLPVQRVEGAPADLPAALQQVGDAGCGVLVVDADTRWAQGAAALSHIHNATQIVPALAIPQSERSPQSGAGVDAGIEPLARWSVTTRLPVLSVQLPIVNTNEQERAFCSKQGRVLPEMDFNELLPGMELNE
jgi:hypothetical protein